MEKEWRHIVHNIDPVYDETSRILILGSFPSVKSREAKFFYGHPRNRFWELISRLLNEKMPENIEEKRALLIRNHIALWDTIHACDIHGSSDSSIRNLVPNDFEPILLTAPIRQIFCNGKKSHAAYCRYCEKNTRRPAIALPSTSPANAAWSMERLMEEWKQILEYLQKG